MNLKTLMTAALNEHDANSPRLHARTFNDTPQRFSWADSQWPKSDTPTHLSAR